MNDQAKRAIEDNIQLLNLNQTEAELVRNLCEIMYVHGIMDTIKEQRQALHK